MQLDDATAVQVTAWLERKLVGETDAEPNVLAEYILALLQNNLPFNEMETMLSEQLIDFLGDKTRAFVHKLLRAIEDQSLSEPISSETSNTDVGMDVSNEAELAGTTQADFRRNFRQGRDGGSPSNGRNGEGVWSNGRFYPNVQGTGGFPSGRQQQQQQGRRNNRDGNNQRDSVRHSLITNRSEFFENNPRLIVEKLPNDHFNEEDIRGYFSKFGELKSVTLTPLYREMVCNCVLHVASLSTTKECRES
jgi:hypothetical protein